MCSKHQLIFVWVFNLETGPTVLLGLRTPGSIPNETTLLRGALHGIMFMRELLD